MPMKTFTLSAVCVLIYCMLLAVNGTTDLLQEKDDVTERLSLGAYHGSEQDDSKTFRVAFASGDHSSALQDWKGRAQQDAVQKEPDYNQRIRNLGILFIGGWIFISFKLLFSK